MGFFGRIFRQVRRNNVRIDDSRRQDQDAKVRAANEETRRNEERTLRRSFEKNARNVEVFNYKKSMISMGGHTPKQSRSSGAQFMNFLRGSGSGQNSSQSSQREGSNVNPMQIQ